MIIFKLPAVLPRIEQPVTSKGKEKIGTSKVSKKGTNLLELPSGCIGKMQVYKSGAVKLKIGETLYDVSSIHVSK
jgi:DNA-directed RNA polymerase III subunit RPC4